MEAPSNCDVSSDLVPAMLVITTAQPPAAAALTAPSLPATPPLTPRGLVMTSPPSLTALSSTSAPALGVVTTSACTSAQPGAVVAVVTGQLSPATTSRVATTNSQPAALAAETSAFACRGGRSPTPPPKSSVLIPPAISIIGPVAQTQPGQSGSSVMHVVGSPATAPRISTTHSQAVAHTVATLSNACGAVSRNPTPPPTPPVPGPPAMSIIGAVAQTQPGPSGSSVVHVVSSPPTSPRVTTVHSQPVAHSVATVVGSSGGVHRSPTPPPAHAVLGPQAMSSMGQAQPGPPGSSPVLVASPPATVPHVSTVHSQAVTHGIVTVASVCTDVNRSSTPPPTPPEPGPPAMPIVVPAPQTQPVPLGSSVVHVMGSPATRPQVSISPSQPVAHAVETFAVSCGGVNQSPPPPPTPPVPGPPVSVIGPVTQTQSGPSGSSVVRVGSPAQAIGCPPEVPLLPLKQLQLQQQAPVAGAHVDAQSRPSSVDTQRRAALPNYLTATAGRSTASCSGAPMRGASATPRPRSAQSRMGAYSYLPAASSRQRIATARGRAAAVAIQAPPTLVTQWPARIRRETTGSPRAASPRGSVARTGSPPRGASMSPRSRGREILPPQSSCLDATWAELLELVNRSRPPIGQRTHVKSSSVSSASGSASGTADSINGKPREQVPPDPWRTRRACQALARLVNSLPDDLLRRVLAVLAEELFHSIFRDYGFSYDPRDEMHNPASAGRSSPPPSPDLHGVVRLSSPGRRPATIPSRPPHLCEESLTNAVPYSAVVQSLRDAAKDAIMRRLELEANCSCSSSFAGEAASVPRSSADGLRAGEEVQLREDLRHARLMADTYQARTLELERARMELEEEMRNVRYEREKDAEKTQHLSEEVRRLRVVRGAKTANKGALPDDGSLPLEPQVTPRVGTSLRTGAAKGGGSGSGVVSTSVGGSVVGSRRSVTDRKSTALSNISSGNTVTEKRTPMHASIDGAKIEDNTTSPAEEESVSPLRRNSTAGEVGFRSNETVQRGMHTCSATSLTAVEQRAIATGPADAAAGGTRSSSKLRRNSGSRSMTAFGALAGSAATSGPISPRGGQAGRTTPMVTRAERSVKSQGVAMKSPTTLSSHRTHIAARS